MKVDFIGTFSLKPTEKNMLFYSNMIKIVADFELVPNSCLEKTYPLAADITPGWYWGSCNETITYSEQTVHEAGT